MYRYVDQLVECGQMAERALSRAGVRPGARAQAPYIWREEGGALRRVSLDAPPEDAARVALQGGDIVIVP